MNRAPIEEDEKGIPGRRDSIAKTKLDVGRQRLGRSELQVGVRL